MGLLERQDQKEGKGDGEEMQVTVNLKNMLSGRTPDIVLEEGDIVIVP